MINVYKAGGDWKTDDGHSYTVKTVNRREADALLADGWCKNLDDTKALTADYKVIDESGSEHESKLREDIKRLGGNPAGRSSIKTLENQLAKLEKENEQD